MNVLEDGLFTLGTGEGVRRRSLPDLLALLLGTEDISTFPALAADQRGYFWRFLVRCAAQALRTRSVTVEDAAARDVSVLPGQIGASLLEHTKPTDWELHQADAGLPGFLQTPTPNGVDPSDDGYDLRTAALLTGTLGAKNHERKSQVARLLDAEALAYALVEYQSGVIYGGVGNYESQFMGSRLGAGSGTPFMGVLLDRSLGKTFRHDVGVLLAGWDEVAAGLAGDIWALWCERWDGETPMPASRLSPAFIPLARMVRVGRTVDGLYGRVWFRPSERSRVHDHTEGGDLGDPFTPMVRDPKGGHLKVRGTLSKGYDYDEIVNLLAPAAGGGRPSRSVSAAYLRPPDASDVRVVFEGMSYSDGKTHGFHRREVRLPKRVIGGLLGGNVEPLHRAHATMLNLTRVTKTRLRSALAIAMHGSPRITDGVGAKTNAVLKQLDQRVDVVYLDKLFAAAESLSGGGNGDATRPYRAWLFALAVDTILPGALRSLPRSEGRRWEQEVRAEAYLRGKLRQDLDLPAPESSGSAHEEEI